MLKIVCWEVKSIESKRFHIRSFFDENFRQNIFCRKTDKLPVFAELWIFGRNRQMRLEKLPPKF